MSEKIRKGNDIRIGWSLYDADEHPYNLEGRNIEIELDVLTKRVRIPSFSVSGNTVTFTYYGKDQKYTGSYALKFIENEGSPDMVTFDTKDAFVLVEHSWLAVDAGETPETIQVEVVTLSSELDSRIGPKGDTGDPAGFGSVTAEVDTETGTPSVEVTTSGPNTAKNFHFAFSGLKGEDGRDGMDGKDGKDGMDGKDGQDGQDGASAYEIAVEHGYVGTEEEWLASLHGADGKDGSDADVTAQNIANALGYTPADANDVPTAEQKAAWDAKYNKPQTGIPASDIAEGVIPDTSQFITKSVSDLVNYYLKSDTYTKAEVQQLIAAIKQFTYQSVAELPTASASTMGIIYLVPSSDPQAQNIKDEFITIDNGSEAQTRYTWEQIGSTAIDLSGYVTTSALNTALANYTTTADLTTLLSGKADKSEMSVTDGTGADADKTTIQLKSGTSATVLKSHQDISGKENSSNKVTSISASSTDTQYPSAKAVYDALYENVLISLGVNSAGTASDLIGLKVTVTNADTSEQISEQTWQGTPLVVRIKAGVRYTVSVQMHPDYVTPASQTFTSELASTRSVGFIYVYSAVIDLSYRDTDGAKKMVQDTANSYVARMAGDYKLPAVYGNAIKNGATNSAAYTRQGPTYTADFVNYRGVQIASPYIETDTGETIASAVLLWQTGANLISNVAFANGYVTFTVNSIPTENGLAVLAVKDGNGDIMWSWTIWLTTDTLTAEKFTNYTEVDYYLMPENIFCIWDEQRTNYGTGMIQWGRKDVMVPNTPGSSSQMTVYDIDGNTITPGTSLGSVIGVFGTDNDQNADKTVANSIKNPGMFFTRYDSTNSNWNNLAWFNNFWNAAETSSASSADNQDTAIKTIYDPCPFGWILPAGRAFTGFTTTGGGTSTASQFNVVGSWSNGWNFKRNSEDTAGNKFIASGYRASGSGAFTYVGSRGNCWSFAPLSQAHARDLYFYSGYVDPQSYDYRSYGFAVRPSRESE